MAVRWSLTITSPGYSGRCVAILAMSVSVCPDQTNPAASDDNDDGDDGDDDADNGCASNPRNIKDLSDAADAFDAFDAFLRRSCRFVRVAQMLLLSFEQISRIELNNCRLDSRINGPDF